MQYNYLYYGLATCAIITCTKDTQVQIEISIHYKARYTYATFPKYADLLSRFSEELALDGGTVGFAPAANKIAVFL